MKWDIEFTDELGDWWATLTEPEQESVKASVELLGEFGPNLRYPYSSGITTSKHAHLRELRIQHAGRPYRVPSCCWAGTRPATRAGTRRTSRWRIAGTTSIWRR